MNKLPCIKENFADWYQEVIYQAELVDQGPVRGTMVIRPYGYAIWENIVKIMDAKIKATGHENTSFPLFIPESFIKKEASHVEGFAPELAIVTQAGGKELDEPLVVRPTSETVVHYMFARWIKSWRDLPLKINHWSNVVRWEMRPRAFLRTTEFLWQEGHTAHATLNEAENEVITMLNEYVDLAQTSLAIPVIAGEKTASERFPGAEKTMTFEAVMQDGKALQMGTSHLLSQKFAHAFNMTFQGKEGHLEYPFLTSWGITTRLIGALVMTHGDANGLVIPPVIAPTQVIIIPIYKKNTDNSSLIVAIEGIKKELENAHVRVSTDLDEFKTPGTKFFKWELKGIPVRIEIGMRDLDEQSVTLVDRLTGTKRQEPISTVALAVKGLLEKIQEDMFAQAQQRLALLSHKAAKLVDYGPRLEKDGGLYQSGWCGSSDCENSLKQYKAFTRCLVKEKTFSHCFNCEKISSSDVLIAKSY